MERLADVLADHKEVEDAIGLGNDLDIITEEQKKEGGGERSRKVGRKEASAGSGEEEEGEGGSGDVEAGRGRGSTRVGGVPLTWYRSSKRSREATMRHRRSDDMIVGRSS